MGLKELVMLSLGAVFSYRLRSFLTALGITVGITAVVLLTSLGEGVHRFVLAEFTQFGTNLIGIAPGKSTTAGISGAIISNVRPMTLADAEALKRIPSVIASVPVVQGNAPVKFSGRSRRTYIFGVGPEAPDVWQFKVAKGSFLPYDDPRSPRALAVLGSKVQDELFGSRNPLGRRVRIGGERYRVVGVMESKGQMLGFDLDDAVYIPATRALSLFNRESLMEIDLLYAAGTSGEEVANRARNLLVARHGSE